jgi:hypothetical protein
MDFGWKKRGGSKYGMKGWEEGEETTWAALAMLKSMLDYSIRKGEPRILVSTQFNRQLGIIGSSWPRE